MAMDLDDTFDEFALPDELRQVIQGHYAAPQLPGNGGELFPVDRHTRISPAEGHMIFRLMEGHGLHKILEIGCAFGFSTMWILAALKHMGGGRLVTIDPTAGSHWQGVGLRCAVTLAMEDRFTWIDKVSAVALAQLYDQGEKFDFVMIDGGHRFDDVMVDFYLADLVCRQGGVIVFDDLWMPSIRKVASFIRANRDYEVIEQPVSNAWVLQKRGPDKRKWDHFVDFGA